ncbi:MAG: HmuY family protein [Gemmatimonadales bacterium]
MVPVHGGGLTRPPILVLVLAGAFLLLVASLLIGSFTKPEFPPYPLTSGASRDGLYTLDASSGDRWRLFRFAHDSAVDAGPWDIAFRRNHVITAPGAGAIDLGVVSFDSVGELPTEGYQETAFAGDSTNPAIGKWYAYSMMSHLLTSKHHVYAVRSAEGQRAKLEILAYYCREVGAACYTIRYKATRPRATESPGAHR